MSNKKETTAVATTQAAPADSRSLKLDKQGMPVFATLGDQVLYADSLVRSGMLPSTYKTGAQVVVALQLAQELGIKGGVKSLSRTCVINNTPSLWGEMPLAIVRGRGLVADEEGFYFDKDLKKISFENKNLNSPVFGFLYRFKRTGEETYHEEYYTIDMAKAAGLYAKTGSVWQKHPEDLLRWRTIGKMLKYKCSDVLSGVSLAEYDHNTMPTSHDQLDVPSMANDKGQTLSVVNERFEEVAQGCPFDEPIDVSYTVSEDGGTEAIGGNDQVNVAVDPPTVQQVDPAPTVVPIAAPDAKTGPLVTATAELADEEAADALSMAAIAELSDFEIPMGAMAGKKLGQLTREQLQGMKNGIRGFLDRKDRNEKEQAAVPTAEKLYEVVTLWIEYGGSN